MAKNLLLNAIESHIGKYVQNLDSDSLNFAIWGGKVELKSLELNVQAVNAEFDRQASQAPNLALPFRVVEGRFETFEVDVPWSRLWSRPIVMRAKGLVVTVAPVDPHKAARFDKASTDNERAERVRNTRIESINIADRYRIQANELAMLAEADMQGGESSADKTMMARLVRRAIENIQIEINNVEVVLLGSEASAGVVLKSLRIVTTNKDGEEEFVDRLTAEDKSLHKLLSLQGLGVYLDEKARAASLTTIDEGDSGEGNENYHDYILAPLSFEAKLAQADGNVCVDDAKYRVESVLSSLDVALSKSQLESIRKIQKQLEPSLDVPRPLFPEYRPATRLSRATAKEWWRYAYRCVGRLNGRRSWVEFFRAFQIRNEYVELYKRHAFETECSWIKALSKDENERLQQIEEDRSVSVEGLMTWRNIADARARREIEKKESQKPKSSLFSSLFTKSSTVKSVEDDPPITLDAEELKELEKLTLSDLRRSDSELSSDSKLCNLAFKLGSLVVNLTNRERNPLSTLNMGEVAASFKANADGSFFFASSLESLAIEDRFTPRTLFPEILSSRYSHTQSWKNRCLLLEFSKTKTGDQKLVVKLAPFEIVVAPVLVLEMVNFASIKDVVGPPTTLKEAHPMLRESLSGSVDLFYDASQGVDLSKIQPQAALLHEKPKTETDYTSALFEAWKAKIESETLWILDMDLAAPAIIVPEKASDPHSSVLVLNLGRFTLRYGDIRASPKVKTWFTENPFPQLTVEGQYDYGSIQMTSLLFAVGVVENWKILAELDGGNAGYDEAHSILSPIHAKMDVGIEIHPSRPRLAAFVDLPLINGKLSPKDIGRIAAVAKTWQRLSDDLIESAQPQSVAIKESDALSQASNASSSSQRLISATKRANDLLLAIGDDETEVFPLIYLGVELKRFSAMLSTDGGSGVESHLGSVSVNATTSSDGNAKVRLTMGWFCVFDRIMSQFTRKQRLLVHSKLPMKEGDIADPGFDIIAALQDRLIGDDSELADIVISYSPRTLLGHRDPFASKDNFNGSDLAVNTIVDGTFSSLFVNWNPYAIRDIVSHLDAFSRLLLVESQSRPGTAILAGVDDATHKTVDVALRGCVLIRARLGGVQMALRSALDDLALFTLSMTNTELALAFGTEDVAEIKADFSLGNIQAVGSDLGQTLSSYRTILGVTPAKSKSLLTVTYAEGQRVLQHVGVEDESIESVGLIQLSPMRLVYIQSQIMALVNYTTEGILGTLTTAAAASAAAAAADIATAGSGRKRFVVNATDFEVVVPEAAYSPRSMSLSVAEVVATYDILSSTLGSKAAVALKGAMIAGELGQKMLKNPSALQLNVVLPEEGIGSAEDQAIRSSISMGNADFCMSSSQYTQLLTMLSNNIGNEELFLRETGLTVTSEVNSIVGAPTIPSTTHAGNLVVENARHIYTAISLAGLSLSLFGVDFDDPIATLTTDETRVHASLFPNGERLSVKVSLTNLECSDERKKSNGRDFRALVYQKDNPETDTVGDLMLLEYETGTRQETTLKATIGSPHIVFVPDAIADLLAFFSDSSLESTENTSGTSESKGLTVDSLSEPRIGERPTEYSVSIVTSECSIVFVDLGSSSLVQSSASNTGLIDSATEALVMKGIFDCKLKCSVEETSEMEPKVTESWELHGNGLQAYTAYMGSNNDAVQVLEPVKVSLYMKKQSNDKAVPELDARFAAVTPVDICLSMKNVALLSAISTGIFDCLGLTVHDAGDTEAKRMKSLSQDAVERYNRANLLLEGDQEAIEASMDTSVAESVEVSYVGTSKPAASIEAESVSQLSLVPKLTIPEVRICFVNDLQGLDDALFRVRIQNVVAGGKIETGVCDIIGKAPYTAFHATSNCSITSDYFDQSRQQWKQLLLKPWELTTRAQRRFDSKTSWKAPQTVCDVESFSCQLAITEQFLMSLASAKHMWDLYATAMTNESSQSDHLRRAVAATAARTFVAVLPYAIENHCGKDVFFVVQHGQEVKYRCSNKTIEYLRFPQPRGKGSGGQRLYGQDRSSKNSLNIIVEGFSIQIPDVDAMILDKRHSHQLPSGAVIILRVQREGKTVIVHVSSSVDITNHCSLPINVFVQMPESLSRQKVSNSFIGQSQSRKSLRQSASVGRDGRMTKPSARLGVPIDSLGVFRAHWITLKTCKLDLTLVPKLASGQEFHGVARIDFRGAVFQQGSSGVTFSFEVTCRDTVVGSAGSSPLILKITVVGYLVDDLPYLQVTLAPRAVLWNRIPLSMSVRTPMPYTLSEKMTQGDHRSPDIHDLDPGHCIEIFTPGPSVAISLRCTDNPVAGNPTDWMQGWEDLSLMPGFGQQPLFVCLPVPTRDLLDASLQRGGTEVLIANKLAPSWDPSFYANEGNEYSIEVSMATEIEESREYLIGISFYAVDHTGEVLFEECKDNVPPPSWSVESANRSLAFNSQSMEDKDPSPISAYRSNSHHGRVTLLPNPNHSVRLLHLTMDGESGYKKSAPFLPQDISICEGGVESTSIPWQSGEESGFYAYQRLVDQYQSEIHIIPAFVIYNGSKKHTVSIRPQAGSEIIVAPGKISALPHHPFEDLKISLHYKEEGLVTKIVDVGKAGLQFALAQTLDDHPVGSVAVETVPGSSDSRWVVKLSELRFGSSELVKSKDHSVFQHDRLRFTIRWTDLSMSLVETAQGQETLRQLNQVTEGKLPKSEALAHPTKAAVLSDPVCAIILQSFTVDWQREFSTREQPQSRHKIIGFGRDSPERSQIAFYVQHIELRDDRRNAKNSVVLSSANEAAVFNLLIHTRGPLSAEFIDVKFADLKVSFRDGKAWPITVKVSEEFIWKLIDLSSRITEAASEFDGYQITLDYDEDHGGYIASVSDHKVSFIENESRYTPPSSNTLYNFHVVQVSPILLVVSFDRQPEKSRYKKHKNVAGANLMNYFSRQLKFKIDKAELRFGAFYKENTVGGFDMLFELLRVRYMSDMRSKIFDVLSSTSFQDWKKMASRRQGDDKFLEGDIMRVTGNLAGRSMNYILKKTSRGLGDGIRVATSRVGDGFESAAGAVGAGNLGSGVNNVVSGVGQGVGDTLSGIGSGVGKVFKGTGQGVGQVFGGMSGGVLHMGKGIGKGLKGDGHGFREGMSQGVTAVGRGTLEGVGSVVGGAAEGVTTFGKGVFSGVKSIGKGFGGAVTGKPKDRKKKGPK